MASFSSEVSLTQSAEFFSRFGRFGGDMEKLQKLLGNDKLMRWWLERLGEFPDFQLIQDLFTCSIIQIARIRELNIEHGWGFSDKDFATIEQSMPEWPAGNLIAVTLVPYLSDGNDMGGVEHTFQELWKVAASLQPANERWEGYDKADPDTLRLLQGIEHPAKEKPVLRWEVIDLGCNRNRKPFDVRNPETSPHAGILASAMLHPEWVKSMDENKVPYVWIPGYEGNISSGIPWQDVPDLGYIRSDRRIGLGYGWCGSCGSSWSVPSFVRE